MSETSPSRGGELGLLLLTALPATLVVYLAFNSGGMFEVTTAFATVAVLAAAVIAIAAAPQPLAGLTPRGLAAAGLLAAFTLWTLLSGDWSDAGARASVAFDRVLLCLAVLVLFACVPRSESRFRWLLRWLLIGTAAVAVIGLLSRVLPSLWPTAPGLVSDRLAYPVTYWNSFGLLVGFACVLALHHASDERERGWVRVGAAALLPALAATLLLTFSRGAIAATLVGLLIYAVAARPRGLPGAAFAAGSTVAIALLATDAADLVHAGTPMSAAALSQAHELAWILAACSVGAAVIRVLTLPLDARLARIEMSARSGRRAWALATTAALIAIGAFLVAGGASALHRQYEKFAENAPAAVEPGNSKSGRLFGFSNDGRLPLWEVAADSFAAKPLIGTGAGTFQVQWQRERQAGQAPERLYAYSLYLETLGELGLVGILLLGGVLLTLLVGAATLIRGPARAAYAAGFALIAAWALHAGVDIDWQTPVTSVPVFALGGLALARRATPTGLVAEPGPGWLEPVAALSGSWLRPLLAFACLVLAVLPAQAAVGRAELTDAVAALGSNDCSAAHDRAKGATVAAEVGPRPDEVLSMCAVREGNTRSAVRHAEAAVALDPESWEPRYVLALARGAGGLDPRQQAQAALAANPSRELLRMAVAEFHGEDPKRWREAARDLPFALE